MSTTLVSVSDYEAAAFGRLDSARWAYLAGGAGDEITLAENMEAFERIKLLPRVLQPFRSGSRGTRLSLLGEELRHPIIVAPMAYQRLFDKDGERATALAAAAQEALMVLSTQSSTPMENVRAAGPACRWFQLYMQPSRAATLMLLRRAEAAGFTALVVTVDAPVSGLRNREQRAGFMLPPEIGADALERLPKSEARAIDEDDSIILDHVMAEAPVWDDIKWLVSETTLPIIIKGILSPTDADGAIEAGAAALVVSNHGGRTLDTVPAAIEALPAISDRVGKRVPLILDGGIRRGTDIVKALALGASAVMVGRPVLFGLAANGAPGVSHVLRLLRDELEVAMALCGVSSLAEIGPDILFRNVWS